MNPTGSRDGALMFLLLAFVFGYFMHNSGWNGNSRLCMVLALVHEGRLEIDSFHEWPPVQTGDKAAYGGHYYSDKSIGVSLLGAIAYLPMFHLARALSLKLNIDTIRHLLTFLVVGVPSAFAGALFYSMCKAASGSATRAYIATLGYALGTMCFAYSALLIGHQLAAAFLFTAFYVAWRRKQAAAASLGSSVAFGLALGMALISDYTSLPLAALIAAYALRNARVGASRAALTWMAAVAGVAVPVALQLANNAICFGSPFRNAYLYHHVPGFQEGIHHGVMGFGGPRADVLFYLTLHPARGLFWQSPVLLSACAGFYYMLRRHEWRAEAILALAAAAAFLLMNSGYFFWWGGWTFGPRFLIPMLPFLALGLAFLPRRHAWHVVPFAAISFIGMLIITAQEPIVPGDFFDIASKPFFAHHPVVASWSRLARGEYGPNLGRLAGLAGHASLAPFFLGATLLSIPFFRSAAPHAIAPTLRSRVDGPPC